MESSVCPGEYITRSSDLSSDVIEKDWPSRRSWKSDPEGLGVYDPGTMAPSTSASLLSGRNVCGNLCSLGGRKGRGPFWVSHRRRRSARTDGSPPVWSGCQWEITMSEMSWLPWPSVGLAGARSSRRTDSRRGMYSGLPSPASTRVYGWCSPTRYVLVPRTGLSVHTLGGLQDGHPVT
jgi:hypothetical protein